MSHKDHSQPIQPHADAVTGFVGGHLAGPVAADFAPIRFSTSAVPERERLPRWREEFGRRFVRMDIEPLPSHLPFHAEAVMQALPGVRTVSCAGSAARLAHTPAMAAESDGSIGLVVNLGTKATVSQRGGEVTLEAGDAFPMRTDEVVVLTGTDYLGFLLPWNALAARVSDLEGALTRVIPRRVEPLRLLVNYLGDAEGWQPVAPELRQSVIRHIHELAALAIGANHGITDVGLKAGAAARLAVALADIAGSFTDPALTVEVVARTGRHATISAAAAASFGNVVHCAERAAIATSLCPAEDVARRQASDL